MYENKVLGDIYITYKKVKKFAQKYLCKYIAYKNIHRFSYKVIVLQ